MPLSSGTRLAVVVALVVAAWWFWPKQRETVFTPVPLTTFPGLSQYPSFSPDGSRVAFSWAGDTQDNVDIYVKQIGTNSLLRLTTNAGGDQFPAWSPDDRHIAFLRAEGGPNKYSIMLIPPLGGSERRIAEITMLAGVAQVPLTWTPDSKWLAVSSRDSSDERFSIWLIPVEAQERRRLTSPPDRNDVSPSFSPDGTMLAFSRILNYVSQPYVLSISRDWNAAGEPRAVTATKYSQIAGIAWSGAREIVYNSGDGAISHLWRADVSGRREPEGLSFGDGAFFPAISTKSRRLAYTLVNAEGTFWRLDTRTGERKTLITSRGGNQMVRYSPDGARIAFASSRSGHLEIWTCNSEGVNCMQMTSFGGPQTGSPSWSPDGRWLAFDARADGVPQIYKIPSEGGTPRRITTGNDESVTPSWSRDGLWIYFASNRSGGKQEIWRMPAEGGPAEQLTKNGGLFPQETFDGKFLYYGNPDRGGLWRMRADGSEETQAVPRMQSMYNWNLTAKGLYFVAPGPPLELCFQDFAGGEIRKVSELEAGQQGVSVSPDGTYVLGAFVRARGDLMLVEGFQ